MDWIPGEKRSSGVQCCDQSWVMRNESRSDEGWTMSMSVLQFCSTPKQGKPSSTTPNSTKRSGVSPGWTIVQPNTKHEKKPSRLAQGQRGRPCHIQGTARAEEALAAPRLQGSQFFPLTWLRNWKTASWRSGKWHQVVWRCPQQQRQQRRAATSSGKKRRGGGPDRLYVLKGMEDAFVEARPGRSTGAPPPTRLLAFQSPPCIRLT